MDFVVRWERSEEDGLWWALVRWLGFDRISGEPWGDSWARESWLTQDLRRKRVVRELSWRVGERGESHEPLPRHLCMIRKGVYCKA